MSAFDLDEVRASLTTRTVLDCYGWKAKRSGSEFESTSCPSRADHSRRAFVINATTGRWQCFPCSTSGDLFDFIAALERLSVKSDFSAVVARAAEIAGVGPSTLSEADRKRRRDEWAAKRIEAEAREDAERAARDAAAIPTATAYWNGLPTKNTRGFDYLCERRIGDVILVKDAVRFDPEHSGSPALALFTRDGKIRNVVSRRVPELGEPKTPGLYRCPSAGTLVNAVCHIEADRDVVLTEGVIDSLTARLAWPEAIVLGAHGAGNLPKIASVAAPVAAQKKARMLVVPHNDKSGFDRAMEACKAALEAGLSIRRGNFDVIEHGQKDLNDAWQLGWRAA